MVCFSGSLEDSNRYKEQLVFVVEIKAGAFLQDAAEVLPELDVLLGFVLVHVFERIENFLRQPFSDLRDVPVFLQALARNVQRQIRGIDHAANKSQIRRQQILAVFHDQNAPHIKMQSELPGLRKQIEWTLGTE